MGDEMMNGHKLPEGWQRATLRQLCANSLGVIQTIGSACHLTMAYCYLRIWTRRSTEG